MPCITMSKRSVTRSEIEPPFEPIGTRDIISTPADTTRSSCPAITAAAALKFVCIEEPHWRSTVVADTSTGQPAAIVAMRPTFQPCSPICVTHPICTSSTSRGSRSERATRPFSTCAASSSPRIAASVPFLRPIGDRIASTMYAPVLTQSIVRGLPGLMVMREVDAPRPQRVDAVDRRRAACDQLAHRVRDVAAEHGQAVVGLDDDRLVPRAVAGGEEDGDAGHDLGVAVEQPVVGALEVDPLMEIARLDRRL